MTPAESSSMNPASRPALARMRSVHCAAHGVRVVAEVGGVQGALVPLPRASRCSGNLDGVRTNRWQTRCLVTLLTRAHV